MVAACGQAPQTAEPPARIGSALSREHPPGYMRLVPSDSWTGGHAHNRRTGGPFLRWTTVELALSASVLDPAFWREDGAISLGGRMPWYVYVAHFLGGAFLANSLPHLVAGITGRAAPTPFASPPFSGMSSARVNVLWALVNLCVAYLLLLRIGSMNLRSWADSGVMFLGFAAMAIQCSRAFSRLRGREATASSTIL
jgi:hypothetical protein